MQLDNLSGLKLIYVFLQSINAEFDWKDDKKSLKIYNGNEYFNKKNILIYDYESLTVYLNSISIIEKYSIEIKIIFNDDENTKTYSCSRLNAADHKFESRILIESILRVVIAWRYGDDVDTVQNLESKVNKDREIPLESLGLSFMLLLKLRKQKIVNVDDLKNYTKNDILQYLNGNQEYLDELIEKLSEISVFLE
jgi:hypothetical protein